MLEILEGQLLLGLFPLLEHELTGSSFLSRIGYSKKNFFLIMHLKVLGRQLNSASYYIDQSIRMAKLKTIKFKLHPENPIWVSLDPRILQTAPPAPNLAHFQTLLSESEHAKATQESGWATSASLPVASRGSVIVFRSRVTDARQKPDFPPTKASWTTALAKCGGMSSEDDTFMMACPVP